MKNILKYFKKQKGLCIKFVVLGFLTTILGILEPKLTATLVTALTEKNLEKMQLFAILVSIIAQLLAKIKHSTRNTSVSIRNKVGKDLKENLYKKSMNIKHCFIGDFKSGELSEFTQTDPQNFLETFQDCMMLLFAIITEITVAVYVTVLSWQISVLFVIFFIILFILQKNSLNQEHKNSKESKTTEDTVKSLINQIYHGILEIKVFNLKNPFFDKYDELLDKEIENSKAEENARSSNRLFSNIAFEWYILFFMLFGIFLMKNKLLSLSSFITIFMYKHHLYSLIFNIAEIRSKIQKMNVLSIRMNKLLQIEDFKLENFGNIMGTDSDSHTISIDDVTFSYNDGSNVLENITLEFNSGEFIGIVGASGSAKTTMVKLLSRQLEPSKGNIKLDGIEYNNFSEKGFSELVALASQEPFLFSFTIRDNLLMVKPNATESEIWKALEDANVADFVKSLPSGLDTVVKEKLNISGGQKQRLSFARLCLRNPEIYLLDEATSAIDARTQADITEVLQNKAHSDGKIVIAVAHRIDAIKSADKILFFENGKIANIGTHKELLNDPRYRKLLNQD